MNEHIKSMLSITDNRFDIIVSDSSNGGEDLQSLFEYDDSRVKIFRIDTDTPAMMNWKSALDHADGIFSFHLNDRDLICVDGLVGFLDFLEKNSDYNGGICKYLSTCQEPKLFVDKNEAFMNVPFFSSHPTGIVFNVKKYRDLGNLTDVFNDYVGIHPHDIILARLSQYGKMFIYTNKVWELASDEFYKKNTSGFQKKNKGFFFEPAERMFELKQNIDEIKRLGFSEKIKENKTKQMYKTYLGLATNTYFYFLESEHETAHYGIARQKFGIVKRIRFAMKILEKFDKEFHFSSNEKKEYKNWLMRQILIPVVAKYTSKINNLLFRRTLRQMRVKRELNDNAVLRG